MGPLLGETEGGLVPPVHRRDRCREGAEDLLRPLQRAELRRRLIEGECAPEALRGAYGQINRQTLRMLVAELGACN